MTASVPLIVCYIFKEVCGILSFLDYHQDLYDLHYASGLDFLRLMIESKREMMYAIWL